MAALTEGRHSGEFILSVGNGNISFDNGVLASGENLAAGAVLAKVDDQFVAIVPGDSGPAADAVAILLTKTNASAATTPCAVVARTAELIGAALVWPDGITDNQKTDAIAQLKALDIVVR